MSNESFAPSRPETAPPTTIEELLQQRDENLSAIVQGHEAGVASLNSDYTQQLDQATPAAASTVFEQMRAGVERHLQTTPGHVETEIGTTASYLAGMLSPHDSHLLQTTIARRIKVYGVASSTVSEAVRQASSPTARAAIRTILDANVLESVKRAVRTYGVSSSVVESMIQNGSSVATRQAIRAALDYQVLGGANRAVRTYGVNSSVVTAIIQRSSSTAAQQAMRSSLDIQVLRGVEGKIRTYGVGSSTVDATLRVASSERAQALINESVVAPARQRRAEQEAARERRYSGHTRGAGYRPGSGNSGSRERTANEGFRFSEEDLFKNFFGTGGGFEDMFRRTYGGRQRTGHTGQGSHREQRHHQQPPRQQPRTHETHTPRDLEVERVVAMAASEPGFKWLATEDPRNVRRVINTVQSARQKAAARDEELSDRDIYVRYRMKAQEAEVGGQTDSTIPHSFQIVSALMGGKASGKLPF